MLILDEAWNEFFDDNEQLQLESKSDDSNIR